MKIIIKSIVFSALFFLVLSCTESEDSQSGASAKVSTSKKEVDNKTVTASVEEDAHPKRKITP